MSKLTMSRWMAEVDGRLNLSELTIPGSHDTMTYGYKGIDQIGVRTQNRSLLGQLRRGIRFIDIRCKHTKNRFALVHGKYYLKSYFGDGVLEVCLDFLKDNPSETIIMSVKSGRHDHNTRSFAATFDWYVQEYKSEAAWYFGDTVPRLDDVRGKIVLLRRFDLDGPGVKGIDATAWRDNATFTIENAADMKIQDRYERPTPSKKWNVVKDLLDEAASGPAERLYLNFCSAAIAPYSPKAFASYVNDKLKAYVGDHDQARLGIVITDFQAESINGRLARTNLNRRARATVGPRLAAHAA